MTFDPSGKIAAMLQRNADLNDAAIRKARSLRDGTEAGDVKAELILALDQVRVCKMAVRFLKASGLSTETREYKKYASELEAAKEQVLDCGRRLDSLGVPFRLVRRDDYEVKS